jgi:acetoin utilization protein AcuB
MAVATQSAFKHANINNIQSPIIDLSDKAFDAYCRNLAALFNIEILNKRHETAFQDIKQLKKQFKKLTATHSFKSEGDLEGDFYIIFEKDTLFALAGIVMQLPQDQIRGTIQNGTAKEADDIYDAVAEAANLLIASWDNIFYQELESHNGLTRTDTTIGISPSKIIKNLAASKDEQALLITYHITIKDLPEFKCFVLFSKSFLDDIEVSVLEENDPAGENQITAGEAEQKNLQDTDETKPPQATAESKTETADETKEPEVTNETTTHDTYEKTTSEESTAEAADQTAREVVDEKKHHKAIDETIPPDDRDQTPAQTQMEKTEIIDEESKPQTKESEDLPPTDTSQKKPETLENTHNNTEPEKEDIKEETTNIEEQTEKVSEHKVSEAIQQMVGSTDENTDLPPEALMNISKSIPSLNLTAKDIMQTNILWAEPDESVQQIQTKMQQHDVSYTLIGKDRVLEGIVSMSDVREAISPYLKSTLSKWRRPLDDATLQIRGKWIMTRTIHTIKPDTPLNEILIHMCDFGIRCLPVINQNNKVEGIITVFDIFKAMIKNSNINVTGKTFETPQSA